MPSPGPRRAVILRRWDRRPPCGGTAVVIDVLRFSTTVCALLAAGRRRVLVAPSPEALAGARDLARSDVFSELEFESPARRFDNSPALALAAEDARAVTYVTTTTGSRALSASRGAGRILVACFANFHAVLRRLKSARGPVWLLPAASPGIALCAKGERLRSEGDSPLLIAPGREEDELCAGAFREALAGDGRAPEIALAALRLTPRIGEFLRTRPKTGEEDLALALDLDRFDVVPEADFPKDPQAPFARIRRAR